MTRDREPTLANRVAIAFELRQASQIWYHMTDRARFKLDPKFKPQDNAFALEDRSGRPGIYLAPSLERWIVEYGYLRPFVVEVRVDPSVVKDPGVHGRYGGEMFVPAASFGKLSIERVLPFEAYDRERCGTWGNVEEDNGTEFDTGDPIPRQTHLHQNSHRGYRYPGPDARSMPSSEVQRFRKRLRQSRKVQSKWGSTHRLASGLAWQPIEYGWSAPAAGHPGSRYEVTRLVDRWKVGFFGPHDRYPQLYIDARGKPYRSPVERVWFDSADDAKQAAERYELERTTVLAPEQIVAKLTPQNRKYLIQLRDGTLAQEFGTKSERPYRSWLTRMQRETERLKLTDWNRLTPLGKQVSALL